MMFLKKEKRIKIILRWILILSLFSLSTISFAAINKEINYQGKLFNSNEQPVNDGDYNIKFRLCSGADCNTVVWSETREGGDKVTIKNGLFSVLLGEVTSLNGIDFNQSLWLGVNIGGTGAASYDGEMTPRKKLGSVNASIVSASLKSDVDQNTISANSANNLLELTQTGAGDILKVNDEAGDTTPFIIDADGNVSIGGSIKDKDGDLGNAGQILSSTGTALDWIDAPTSASGSIDTHSDVDTSTTAPTNGQVLTWNGANWVPQDTQEHTGTTGSIFFADDVNGEPTEDNDQLFWDATNNRLGIGTNNPSHKLQVTGQIRATNFSGADGTAGSPIYRFNSDTDTGMFRGAADQLAFTTDGTERIRIDDEGNVGIGETSPNDKLEIISDDDTALRIRTTATDKSAYIQLGTDSSNRGSIGYINNDSVFRIGAASNVGGPAMLRDYTRLAITSTGMVGIGTDNPAYRLTVKGDNDTTTFGIKIGDNAAYKFHANSTSGYSALFDINDTGFDIGNDSGTRALNLKTDNTDRLTILGGGNIGIGTTTPTDKFQVAGDFRLDGAFKDKDGDAGVAGQILSSTNTGTDWIAANTVGTDDQNISGSGLSGDTLTIGIENGTNETVSLSQYVDSTELGSWAGSTNLTTLGTITTGTWNGTSIGDAYLTKTGDWTGTFDGQEGTYYLNWNNLTNIPADISDGDDDTTYTAGTGLSLSGTTFALNSGIDNLTDVDTSTTAPVNGQVLSWDGSNWIPSDTASGDNIYTANGSLTGDREVDLDNHNLGFINGNVGIGTSSPNQKLTVDGSFGILEGGASPTYHTIFQGGDQSADITYTLPTADGTSGQVLSTNGSGVLSWADGGTGGGSVGPSFKVHRNGSTQTVSANTWTKIDWTTEDFDTNNNFDLANDRFQPTVAGKYVVAASVYVDGTQVHLTIRKNGSSVLYDVERTGNEIAGTSGVIDMNGTTDYLEVYAYDKDGTNLYGDKAYTVFSGSLVGGGGSGLGVEEINDLSDAQKDAHNNLFLGQSGFSGTYYNDYNTSLGLEAFDNSNSDNSQGYYGDSNTAIGYQALTDNTTGYYNTAQGAGALYSNTTGHHNTAVGMNSLYSNTEGYSNSTLGSYTLDSNTTGYNNTAIGNYALYGSIDGLNNTALGLSAGRYIADGSTINTTGDYNTFLGTNTKANADDDQNEIVIGYDATGLGSNTVVLGNDSIVTTSLKGNVGIGTTTPTDKLQVAGDFRLDGAFKDKDGDAGVAGQILSSTGTGTDWVEDKDTLGGLSCADGETAKWDATASQWICGADRSTYHQIMAADYTNNSTTLSDVPDMSFSVGANEDWYFEMNLQVNADADDDLKARITCPTGADGNWSIGSVEQANSHGNISCDTTSAKINMNNASDPVYIQGLIQNGGTAGTIQLRLKENTASDAANGITVFAGSVLQAWKLSGADYAEIYYSKDNDIQKGAIVSLDTDIKAGVKLATKENSQKIIGVVSTEPGNVIGSVVEHELGTSPVAVALKGRIPIKVNSENGEIKAGDKITISSKAGVGMKATEAGYVVGTAITGFNGDDEGIILIFVDNQWYPGDEQSLTNFKKEQEEFIQKISQIGNDNQNSEAEADEDLNSDSDTGVLKSIWDYIVEVILKLWDKVFENSNDIKELKEENELLKFELCRVNNTYSWCTHQNMDETENSNSGNTQNNSADEDISNSEENSEGENSQNQNENPDKESTEEQAEENNSEGNQESQGTEENTEEGIDNNSNENSENTPETEDNSSAEDSTQDENNIEEETANEDDSENEENENTDTESDSSDTQESQNSEEFVNNEEENQESQNESSEETTSSDENSSDNVENNQESQGAEEDSGNEVSENSNKEEGANIQNETGGEEEVNTQNESQEDTQSDNQEDEETTEDTNQNNSENSENSDDSSAEEENTDSTNTENNQENNQ